VERRASLGAEGDPPTLSPRSIHTLQFPDGGRLVLGQRTLVMGVLNVTPDSFFDGGRHATLPLALERARSMVEEGAAIVDVGGESTRPGARPVGAAEEADRVLPVIEALRGLAGVRISIDPTKAHVARQALEAGADMVNDVSALGDPAMAPLLAAAAAPVVLMHMRGPPETRQPDTDYGALGGAVADFLRGCDGW
jgi:dihydropteroate synthase